MTYIATATRRSALVVVVAFVLAGCGGTTGARSKAAPAGDVHGKVTAGPTCPVERVGHPCPPRPFTATIRASVGTRIVASTRSAADGSYDLELSTGMYTITATTGNVFPRCDPKQVTVVAGARVEADVSCDTGIR